MAWSERLEIGFAKINKRTKLVPMSYVTVEVEINRGRIVPREPDKLPERASGLLTILPSAGNSCAAGTPESWPRGYFEKTAGAFANEPFERPPQLPFEKREEW